MPGVVPVIAIQSMRVPVKVIEAVAPEVLERP